jgi:hypothetical protein
MFDLTRRRNATDIGAPGGNFQLEVANNELITITLTITPIK